MARVTTGFSERRCGTTRRATVESRCQVGAVADIGRCRDRVESRWNLLKLNGTDSPSAESRGSPCHRLSDPDWTQIHRLHPSSEKDSPAQSLVGPAANPRSLLGGSATLLIHARAPSRIGASGGLVFGLHTLFGWLRCRYLKGIMLQMSPRC